jgi:hypothetical protein
MGMPEKEHVVVYGLPADSDIAQYNLRIGTVRAKNPDTFQVTVAFADKKTFTVASASSRHWRASTSSPRPSASYPMSPSTHGWT